MTSRPDLPLFEAPYAAPDETIARRLLSQVRVRPERVPSIEAEAAQLVAALRRTPAQLGSIEQMLREYALTTREGLALMVLAEALLRIPDKATMDELIEDRLGQPDFADHVPRSGGLLAHASVWALGVASSIFQPSETPVGILVQAARRLGRPALRTAMRQAISLMGDHFVFGTTIEGARSRAAQHHDDRGLFSFDMLGEGARTQDDADRYAASYRHAIEVLSADAEDAPERRNRPGISVKLSALHPRYEPLARQRVIDELTPVLRDLACRARAAHLSFTVDAEEADRLDLSLDIVGRVLADPELAGWDGFGIAVQAYQKRAMAVIDYMVALADHLDRRIAIRLVKGAYWDTEIKRAQERGLADFPVFTRKAMTDLNYLACAQRLLACRPRLFPQFATHNALTIATVRDMAGDDAGSYEFQRLFGMGEAIYGEMARLHPDVACRIYAPVGPTRDLLAYLVRRLIENGASTSFVARASDPAASLDDLLRQPSAALDMEHPRAPHIALPRDLFGPSRLNSPGVEFGDPAALRQLLRLVRENAGPGYAAPIIDGRLRTGHKRTVTSPIDGAPIGHVVDADAELADTAMEAAQRGFAGWTRTKVETRAAVLFKAADLIEERRARLIALLQAEAGKTLDDAVSEWRESIDFCRYYAAEGLRILRAQDMPGPVGETNEWRLLGRGVFVAISPWNFPLAIFTGQIVAALMAGNSVVAKPAEQTPLIAAEAVRLLHDAGIPKDALHFVTGDGHVGARLVAHAATGGVVFTGSGEVARLINRALAAREGEIVPLIAETGGINAMIVDSTALPEQATDDILASAFRSAGQRCSALRHLYIQSDVAEPILNMIRGALSTWEIGDPRDAATRIGPVIDADARRALDDYIAEASQKHLVLYAGTAPSAGHFVAPHVFELEDPAELTREIFGPVLHVTRFERDDLENILGVVSGTGYGLTFGLQSRIDASARTILRRLRVGNVYVNRNMIGAVVGSQPFGGAGLSGTGPKAGGPHYLPRFCTEQSICRNIAALGGDPALLGSGD
ncbi:MAG: delta-pyrroline-5-carboxylate dehydrogenase [Hyphomicrobiales bacterium]|nr:delta-pyrroline-5-carboxylate dehydrogenase [Hyphomicrobiales bacterium]